MNEPGAKDIEYAAPNRHWKKWVTTAVVGLLGLLSFISIFLAYEIFVPHASFIGNTSIEIPAGAGSRRIGGILRESGAIRSKWAFVTYVSLKGHASSLKPGRYLLNSEMAIPAIAENLLHGGRNEIEITIPEGWSTRDIAQLFEYNGLFMAEEFMELAGFPGVDYRNADGMPPPKDFSGRFAFLQDKPEYMGLEGYLFPDTYRVFSDATAEDVIATFLKNFDRKFTQELRDETAHQKKSLFDIVTMASLIEKEVVLDKDRAIVSGILWKRLEIGMPLQVDATIAYITGKKSTKISREETQIDSPFNTYAHPGLPLGPISNPGMAALRAALYPENSPFFYYLSTPEGETIFSKTLDEHNEAKAEHLR